MSRLVHPQAEVIRAIVSGSLLLSSLSLSSSSSSSLSLLLNRHCLSLDVSLPFLDLPRCPLFLPLSRRSMNGQQFVEDTDLEINQACRYGLIGANGSGKTNLICALAMREVPIPVRHQRDGMQVRGWTELHHLFSAARNARGPGPDTQEDDTKTTETPAHTNPSHDVGWQNRGSCWDH